MLIESRFGFVSELTTRGTTLPLSPTYGSSIEQRGHKKVHWKERVFNTLVKSSRLVLVMSVLSLERNGTSVALTHSGDYDSSRQPRPFLQSSRVSLRTDQMRSGTCWVQANWRVTVEGKSSVNKLAGVFPSPITTVQEGGATSSTDVAEPVTDFTEVHKTLAESVASSQTGSMCIERTERYCRVHTHSLLAVYGKAVDDPHRRRQDSDLEDASSDRTNIAVETAMDKVLVTRERLQRWRVQKTSLSTRSESVAMGWTSGDLVCVKMRQQRSHC